MKDFGKKLTIIIFLALLFIPATAGILKEDAAYSETENRYLKQKPSVSAEEILDGTFESAYEEYVKDQFILRDGFVGLKNRIDTALGKRLINGIFVCSDSLIQNTEESAYESSRAATNREVLAEAAGRWKKMENISTVSVMPVPTAQTIQSYKLPQYAQAYDETRYTDSIREALEDVEGAFVDAGSALAAHADEYIYYRTDHHWTTYGAYLSYLAFCDSTGIEAYSMEDFDVTTVTDEFYGTLHSKLNIDIGADRILLYAPKGLTLTAVYNGDESTAASPFDYSKLETKDKYAFFFGGNTGIVELRGDGGEKSGRNILVIKDSYANCLAPMLAGTFDGVYMMDLRYYSSGVDTFIKENNITDILVLYNTASLTEDAYVSRLKTSLQ